MVLFFLYLHLHFHARTINNLLFWDDGFGFGYFTEEK